jgi:hypothetical protein
MNFSRMDKHQLAATWQVRCLKAADYKFASVMLTVFYFVYMEQAQYLMWQAYGRASDLRFPTSTSAGSASGSRCGAMSRCSTPRAS